MNPNHDLNKQKNRGAGKKQHAGIIGILMLAAVLLLCIWAAWQRSRPSAPPEQADGSSFRVRFLDVGNADATLVECDGHYMLIDGGYAESSDKIYTVLKDEGAETIDYLVCTHGHADHCEGLAAAFHAAAVGTVFAPVQEDPENYFFEKFAGQVTKAALEITVPDPGGEYALGSAVFTILGPLTTEVEDLNDTSLIIRIVYGETSFLFCGDATWTEETSLLEVGCVPETTVLKAAHHGSGASTCYQWLYAVDPQYTVISCGKQNEYGHPHGSLLSRIRDQGSMLYRTDLQGDITAESDGNTVVFTVEKNPDADVFVPGDSLQ
jgi:competence protein ComEC